MSATIRPFLKLVVNNALKPSPASINRSDYHEYVCPNCTQAKAMHSVVTWKKKEEIIKFHGNCIACNLAVNAWANRKDIEGEIYLRVVRDFWAKEIILYSIEVIADEPIESIPEKYHITIVGGSLSA